MKSFLLFCRLYEIDYQLAVEIFIQGLLIRNHSSKKNVVILFKNILK
jgi:hypothetical protein